MALDRRSLALGVAAARRRLRREREADVAALKSWYVGELLQLQHEITELRREMGADRATLHEALRAARLELNRWRQISDAVDTTRDFSERLH
jgi:hypothetical protein